jgi:hypothetical protein
MNNVAQNLTGMQTIQQMLKTESETRGIVEKWKSGKVEKWKSVPGAGVEPARHCWRQILSLVRLPISPSRHTGDRFTLIRRRGQ